MYICYSVQARGKHKGAFVHGTRKTKTQEPSSLNEIMGKGIQPARSMGNERTWDGTRKLHATVLGLGMMIACGPLFSLNKKKLLHTIAYTAAWGVQCIYFRIAPWIILRVRVTERALVTHIQLLSDLIKGTLSNRTARV